MPGVIRLVAEGPVEFGRVADRLVDRQGQVGRQEDQVLDARRDRGGLEVLDGLLGHALGVVEEAGPLDGLVARADRVGPVGPRLDLAAGLDDRRGELGGDLDDVLLDHAPLGRGEEAVFEPGGDERGDREDAGDLAGLGRDRAEQFELLLDRDRERVDVGRGPVHVLVGGRRGQLDRLPAERGVGLGDGDGLGRRRAIASLVTSLEAENPQAPSARTRRPKPNETVSETVGTSTGLPVARSIVERNVTAWLR